MNIQTSEAGHRQHFPGKQIRECRNHDDFRLELRKRYDTLLSAHGRGLNDTKAVLKRNSFNRRWSHVPPASRRTLRPSVHSDYLAGAACELFQDWHAEFRRAHENNSRIHVRHIFRGLSYLCQSVPREALGPLLN